jgi:hypothetical protein
MADEVEQPQWGIAPYFIVEHVVATANFGYRLCFGHDTSARPAN